MPDTETNKELPVHFPKNFMWGAATSAHQVEGNTHNQWTVWELENAKHLAVKAAKDETWLPEWKEHVKASATDPHNYVSGMAADHFNRYEQDFDILTKLNMNTFRFSVEWSRIEPTEGVWDAAAIDHYRNYLKALKSRGIEPLMTLMHWTLPTWFASRGGFEKRSNIKYFVRFAEKVLSELGSDVRYICTINEPETYVYSSYVTGDWPPEKSNKLLALWVYLNLAYAHNKVAKVARHMNRHFYVGLSKNCAYNHANDHSWKSRVGVKVADWAADYFFLNKVSRHMDWLGLNYYFTNEFTGFKEHFGYAVKERKEHRSNMGADMQPQNIQFVMERLYAKYHIPIIVTENGVADEEDEYRQWWIAQTLTAIYKAMKNGVDTRGYLHWSLLDNFEWAQGKWPRFGLVHVDYKNFKRTPRKSAVWLGQLLKKIRGL